MFLRPGRKPETPMHQQLNDEMLGAGGDDDCMMQIACSDGNRQESSERSKAALITVENSVDQNRQFESGMEKTMSVSKKFFVFVFILFLWFFMVFIVFKI